MKITREFIEAHRTKRGGFTFAQAQALGSGWPPERGWLKRAVLVEHTPEAIVMFVEFAERATTKKERKVQRADRYQKIGAAQIDRVVGPAKHPKKKPVQSWINPQSDEFLSGYQWRELRMKALTKYGRKCMCCGATPESGSVMHVDHIRPRRLFPMLALDLENLQILCHECNHGKGNWDQTDWRPQEEHIDPEIVALVRDIGRC